MTGLSETLPALDLTKPLALYRLCRIEYADLTGMGAALYPGRWNRLGQRAVYTATSRSLALTETIVHLPKPAKPRNYALVTIVLDPSEDTVLRQSLETARTWFESFGKAMIEAIGDPIAFAAPSVIVPEYNVVSVPSPAKIRTGLRTNQIHRSLRTRPAFLGFASGHGYGLIEKLRGLGLLVGL